MTLSLFFLFQNHLFWGKGINLATPLNFPPFPYSCVSFLTTRPSPPYGFILLCRSIPLYAFSSPPQPYGLSSLISSPVLFSRFSPLSLRVKNFYKFPYLKTEDLSLLLLYTAVFPLGSWTIHVRFPLPFCLSSLQRPLPPLNPPWIPSLEKSFSTHFFFTRTGFPLFSNWPLLQSRLLSISPYSG